MRERRIGLVGLGLMGGAMAKNLLSDGFPVVGYDIEKAKVDALVKMGGEGVDSPERLAARVDVIMTSLPNSYAVNDVVKKALKLFETERRGLVLIDTTTADPILSEELAAHLRAKGIEMLDATISGTSKMCAEKDIIFMVGGKEEIFRKCEPLFSSLAKETLFMGKNGAGALAKLVVNLVLGLNRMALAEGLALAKKSGMDLPRALEVLKKSAAYSKVMDMKGQKMVEKDFLPAESKLGNYAKDMQLILDVGRRINFPLPLVGLLAQALASGVAKGRGEWDSAAIISFYEELAHI